MSGTRAPVRGVRGRRGRQPSKRDPDDLDAYGETVDMVDELPGEDLDLARELRNMGIASGGARVARGRGLFD